MLPRRFTLYRSGGLNCNLNKLGRVERHLGVWEMVRRLSLDVSTVVAKENWRKYIVYTYVGI